MAEFSIYNVTPGETAQLTFTVSGLATGETISNATLEIRSRGGEVMVPVKTVTSIETDDGIVQVVDGVPTLIFELAASETETLHAREPYYLFAVNVLTSLGRRQAIVPIGRLSPSRTLASGVPVRLGRASVAIGLKGIVTGMPAHYGSASVAIGLAGTAAGVSA